MKPTKRTYVLIVLILICVGYIAGKRYFHPHDALASAKEKIQHIAQQPTARSGREPALGTASAPRPGPAGQPPGDREPSWSSEPVASDNEKAVHLTKGTFTVVDGTIVYGPGAELDIGHGMLISSPSGVMVSDVDQKHFAGDLVIDSQDGTVTSTENAFVSVDQSHIEMTSDTATTVKKDEPK